MTTDHTPELRIVTEADRPPQAQIEYEAAIERMTVAMGRPPTNEEKANLLNRIAMRTIDAAIEATATRPDWLMSTENDIAGDAFGLNIPDTLPAIWGADERAYWSDGELAILWGGDGTNKTTIAHNVMAGMLGFEGFETVTGQPVRPMAPGEQILYLAFDRPRQIERSWSRFMQPRYADRARDGIIWRTDSLPFDPARHPLAVADWIADVYPRVRYSVWDNVWDAFGDFNNTDNATSAGIALNAVARSGVNVLALHHNRKGGQASKKAPDTHDSLYGGRNFAAKAGSIVNVWKPEGNDGSSVTITQTKEASERIPRQTLYVDARRGTLTRLSSDDMTLAKLLQTRSPEWVEISELAQVHRHTDKPTEADKQATRRALDGMKEVEHRKAETGKAGGWRWAT